MPEPGFDSEDPQGRKGPKLPPPRMRMSRGVVSWIGFALVALTIAIVINNEYSPTYSITIDKFYQELSEGAYKSVTVSDDKVVGVYKPGKERKGANRFSLTLRVESPEKFTDELRLKAPGTEIRYEQSAQPFITMLLNLIPWILIFG